MAQAARLASRLQRELTMLHSDPPPGVSAWPCHDHLLTHLQAQIHGPQGTVYSNGIFKLDIQVPERYPFEPPNIKFITPVYHPNIDNGGRICLDILNLPPKGAWRPSLNLSTLLASIGLLLAEPNPDDGLMGEITAEYKHDRPSFDRKARKWTELYAGQDQLTSELNEPKTSSCSETNQKLAPVRSNSQEPLQVAPSKGPEAIITKCDSFSQPLRSGLSLNKRLALDRGTTCLQQNKPTSSNVSHVNFNPVVHAVASKEIMSPLEKEDTGLQAPSCRKHSSKELAIREEQSKNDLASETAKVTSLDKKKSSSHVDRNSPHNEERSSCRNLSKGLFHEMAAGKSNAVLDASFPNASLVERATEVGKGPQLDEGCTPSVSISAKVRSNDMGNVSADKNSRKKVEDWKDIASIGKENQTPKHCPALKPGAVISSQSAGRKEMVEITPMEPSGVVNSATVFNNIMHEPGKEKGYVCLPLRTKSLKLARAKPDSQPFQSMTSQQNMQSIPVAKKWSSPPIIIPDDIPTVVVSDSGSDSELSDEGFTLSLTQRSFRNKRKAGSNLR